MISQAQKLVEEYQSIVRQREVGKFVNWIEKYKESLIPAFKGFVAGLQRDLAAVTAALEYEWSNGQVEGQLNRLFQDHQKCVRAC